MSDPTRGITGSESGLPIRRRGSLIFRAGWSRRGVWEWANDLVSRPGWRWRTCPASISDPWKLGQFQLVARHLGQFNGAYLAGRRLPADSWLSIDWLQEWTARMEPLDLLTAARDHPLVQQIFSPAMRSALASLAADRRLLLDALSKLPQTLCHRDVFPRNAFLRRTAEGAQTVAIDWAFCGPGPVGSDLVPLVEASLTWFEADRGSLG